LLNTKYSQEYTAFLIWVRIKYSSFAWLFFNIIDFYNRMSINGNTIIISHCLLCTIQNQQSHFFFNSAWQWMAGPPQSTCFLLLHFHTTKHWWCTAYINPNLALTQLETLNQQHTSSDPWVIYLSIIWIDHNPSIPSSTQMYPWRWTFITTLHTLQRSIDQPSPSGSLSKPALAH